jgi:hypothetical protein
MTEETQKQTQAQTNPLDRLHKDNFVPKYMKYMATQYDGYHEWNLAGALQLLSIIADRKIKIELAQQTVFPNICIFGIADSTVSRKTTGMQKAKSFLAPLGLEDKKLPDAFSPEKLIEELSEKPHAFFWKDEAAGLLASFTKSYMADMRDLLMELYECNSYRRSLRTSQRQDKKTDFSIDEPYLSMWFLTTPDNFCKYATTLDVTSGWLLRFLFFTPDGKKRWMGFREKTQQDLDGYFELVKILSERKKQIDDSPPIQLKLTSDAWTFFQEWQQKRETEIMAQGDSIASSIFGRLETYALKLAILFEMGNPVFTLSCNGLKENIGQIQKNELEIACNLIDEFFLHNAKIMVKKLEESNEMKTINHVKEIVHKHKEISKSALLRLMHKPAYQVNNAISHLMETGEITGYDDANRGGFWLEAVP